MAVFRCRISRLAGSKGDIGVRAARIYSLLEPVYLREQFVATYVRRDKERGKYSLVNTGTQSRRTESRNRVEGRKITVGRENGTCAS